MTIQSQENLRILVVDDDPIFRSLAVSRLVKLAQEVVEAGDGAAAWSMLAREPFQLALVDLEMPNLRGDELIRCIRGHPRTRHMPVIVITSRNDAEAVRSSLEAGATSFLTKPINWSMFANHIDYLLKLNRIAERGHRAHEEAQETISSVTELAASLAAEMSKMTDRLEHSARAAIESWNVPNQTARAMAALQSLIKETEQGRQSLATAIGAIEKAARGDARPASPAAESKLLKVS